MRWLSDKNISIYFFRSNSPALKRITQCALNVLSSRSWRPENTNSSSSPEIPDSLPLRFQVSFLSGAHKALFTRVFAINCYWGGEPSWSKPATFYWALILVWMRRFTVERCEDSGDWGGGCTVRVPDSHCPSPHFRSTGKKVNAPLPAVEREGGGNRAGGSKLLGMYFCKIWNSDTLDSLGKLFLI